MNPKVRLRVGHQHSQFWPILARFMDYYSPFWGPEVISTINEPWVLSRAGHVHSRCWPILARFVDYYSPIWGPRAIFMVAEAQGVLRCRSSTLATLADSGPFHGLLPLIWGFRAISIIYNPRVRLRLCRQHSQFWPILTRFVDYYSSFRGHEAIP